MAKSIIFAEMCKSFELYWDVDVSLLFINTHTLIFLMIAAVLCKRNPSKWAIAALDRFLSTNWCYTIISVGSMISKIFRVMRSRVFAPDIFYRDFYGDRVEFMSIVWSSLSWVLYRSAYLVFRNATGNGWLQCRYCLIRYSVWSLPIYNMAV